MIKMKQIGIFSSALLLATATWAISPQSGTWIVSDELNGEPGRGIALDVQGNILSMQIYAYKPDGNSAFYLSVGQLSENNTYESSLNEFKDGRYFGSEPKNGREAGSPGNVKVRFINGTSGFIQFPDEPERAFHRYQFRYGENPESLLGYWVTTATSPSTLVTLGGSLNLTDIGPATSTGTGIARDTKGSTACEFQRDTNGIVICVNAINGRPTRAYAFKLSVNEGFGVTYTTTFTGAQLGKTELLTTKRLITSDNQVIGLLDAYSTDMTKSLPAYEFAVQSDELPANLSDVFGLISTEVTASGLLGN